jgi:hypothetical protein
MTIQSGKSLFLSSDEVVGFGGSGSGVGQVVKIYVPTLISVAETPTWAEVRWTKRLLLSSI